MGRWVRRPREARVDSGFCAVRRVGLRPGLEVRMSCWFWKTAVADRTDPIP
jgi:hypothetical protein